MMTPVYVFLATFLTVFSLGFQSLNVNKGHRYMADATSFIIGGSHLVLYKVLPNASWQASTAYLFAGPLAITTAMRCHDRYRNWLQRRSA